MVGRFMGFFPRMEVFARAAGVRPRFARHEPPPGPGAHEAEIGCAGSIAVTLRWRALPNGASRQLLPAASESGKPAAHLLRAILLFAAGLGSGPAAWDIFGARNPPIFGDVGWTCRPSARRRTRP